MQLSLKNFLLNEEKVYLSEQIGDVLEALQSLNDDARNMGKRHLIRVITNIVKQIRRILHGNWTYEEEIYLKSLQKVGVALMKGLDDNEDLLSLISSCVSELEKVTGKLKEPINQLGSPDEKKEDEES